MDNTSEDLKLVSIPKGKYIFCINISRWVSNSNKTLSESPLAACGIVSYKLIGKCHLPPCSFPFIELSQNEDALKIVDAAEDSGINSNEKEGEKSDTEEEKEINQPALIRKLSVDCLIEIFSYLPLEQRLVVEDVCVHWRDVSKKAWHNVRELHFCTIIECSPISYSKFIEKLLIRCGIYLKTLEINIKCSSSLLQMIGEYCHNLTTIGLEFTKDIDHFNGLSKLTKLQSFRTAGNSRECLRNCLLNLPKTIKTIHIGFLSIDNNMKFSITNIFERFTELESLSLGAWHYEKDFMEVISKKITITDFSVKFMDHKIDLKLLANLSNLTHLDLSKVYHVDDDFLRCISTKCQKLKYLDLTYCDISDEGVSELRNLNNLEVLYVSATKITDRSLGQLRGIKKLHCQCCLGVKDAGIVQLIENSPDLEELNIEETSISVITLLVVIRETRKRKNGVILSLSFDSEKLGFNSQSEYYSPFLKIYGLSDDEERNYHVNHLECEHDDYNYEEYEKYRRLSSIDF